jgi:hypothetical protein
LRDDKAFIDFITSRRFLIWALLLGGVHVLFMGYSGWLSPAGWHGGLPPISLVAFVVFVLVKFLRPGAARSTINDMPRSLSESGS